MIAHERDRRKHFSTHWMAWSSLHHFLPAPLLREFCLVIIDVVSDGALTFDQLFDELLTEGPVAFDAWLLKPRECASPTGEYLQRRIRAFGWRSDVVWLAGPDSIHKYGTNKPLALEAAVEFGTFDLALDEQVLSRIRLSGDQASFGLLLAAFSAVRGRIENADIIELLGEISAIIDPVEQPLRTVIYKHLGDLCADSDRWDHAKALYERAQDLVGRADKEGWQSLHKCLSPIIRQSLATATGVQLGAKEALTVLDQDVDASAEDGLFFAANSSFDRYVAETQASLPNLVSADRRTVVVLPPLLHKSQASSSALGQWADAAYGDANRSFWALLRRQISLGSAVETKITKAQYARNILDELTAELGRQIRPPSFLMAIRLLIESGNKRVASQIDWNEKLLDQYVTDQAVDMVLSRVDAYTGSRFERRAAAIQLFREWCERLDIGRADVIVRMLRFVVKVASESEASFFEALDLACPALETLEAVGNKRPEVRRLIASDVAGVIATRLRANDFWRGRQVALETALAYIKVFQRDSLEQVVDATLTVLGELDPKAGLWPVVRPAMRLLTSQTVKRLAHELPNKGADIVNAILKFGLAQDSEHAQLLMYLQDLPNQLLEMPTVRQALAVAVSHVRQRALAITASDAITNIEALLLSPAVSGSDGVSDAITGLQGILRSVTDHHPSMSFATAYEALFLLADRLTQIPEQLGLEQGKFVSWLHAIMDLVLVVWNAANERPLIFSPFSLPPATMPNSAVVHNWALASIRLAECIGRQEEVRTVLLLGMNQTMLGDAIRLALAGRLAAGRESSVDTVAIRKEAKDVFYSALGRRLAAVLRMDSDQSQDLCKALLDQCLRHGPRDQDLAVFIVAWRNDLQAYVKESAFLSDYARRLESDRKLALFVTPILEQIGAIAEAD